GACFLFFFFSSRRRHTRSKRDWSSDVCSSDLPPTRFVEIHRWDRVPRSQFSSSSTSRPSRHIRQAASGYENALPGLLKPALASRSEEHTSELQSRFDLVCRLLLEKKKINNLHI